MALILFLKYNQAHIFIAIEVGGETYILYNDQTFKEHKTDKRSFFRMFNLLRDFFSHSFLMKVRKYNDLIINYKDKKEEGGHYFSDTVRFINGA